MSLLFVSESTSICFQFNKEKALVSNSKNIVFRKISLPPLARRHAPAGELGRNPGTRGHGAAADALVWRWMIDWGRGSRRCEMPPDRAHCCSCSYRTPRHSDEIVTLGQRWGRWGFIWLFFSSQTRLFPPAESIVPQARKLKDN